MQPARLIRILRVAMLAMPLAVSACGTLGALSGATTTERLPDTRTQLTRDAALTLPVRPNYPRTESIVQTVVGRYDDRRTAFQAILDLSPEQVTIVLTAPSGPRIMTINWTQAGVTVERTSLAPDELSALNILGDVFLTLWPDDVVSAALPPGFQLQDDAEIRTIIGPDGPAVRIKRGAITDGVQRTSFANLAFGYTLTIITEAGS